MDLLSDTMANAEVIALQETWCDPDQDNRHLALPEYHMHFASQGNGKGVVTYFKGTYRVSATINKQSYQMIKLTGNRFSVINLYCSKGANKQQFFSDLMTLLRGTLCCIIVGDFNDNFLKEPKSNFVQQMIAQKLTQLVETPTHAEGGLLDHVYVTNTKWQLNTEVNFRYYSDHAAITIMKANDDEVDEAMSS